MRPGGAARAGSARRSAGLISESRLGPAGRSFGVCVLVMVYDMRPERGGSQRRLVVVLPVFRLGEGPRINSGVKCGAGVYARRGHAWRGGDYDRGIQGNAWRNSKLSILGSEGVRGEHVQHMERSLPRR